MPDPPGGERREDQPGWAAPSLPPTEPSTAPLPPPGMPAVPPPGVPAAPVPPGGWAPGGWTPGWGPTLPPRRSRRWVVVLVAVLSLALAAAIAGTVLFVDSTLPPYNAAHDFIDDVFHGRTSSASARLCAHDRERARGALYRVRSTFGFGTTPSVNVFSVDRDGNRATVDYSVDTSPHVTTYTLEMRREGGSWKACPGAGGLR
jgi:hypothetical protein